MALQTVNVNDGMADTGAVAIPAGFDLVDGKVYQRVFLALPQFAGVAGAESVPERVADSTLNNIAFPVFDNEAVSKLALISDGIVNSADAANRAPFGNGGSGWFRRGYLSLSNTTEQTIISFARPTNLQELIIDNADTADCCVKIRRVTADTEIYPFRVKAGETKVFTFMGGIQKNTGTSDWTVQLVATPTNPVTVYAISNELSF